MTENHIQIAHVDCTGTLKQWHVYREYLQLEYYAEEEKMTKGFPPHPATIHLTTLNIGY